MNTIKLCFYPNRPFHHQLPFNMTSIIHSFGGYRRTLSFSYTCLIYHATCAFCQKNYPYPKDPLGKTSGQMIGAARSARQNIVEGSSRAGTSRETELKLYDVAKASLQELAGDYEAFLIQNDSPPWSINSPQAQSLREIDIKPFVHQQFEDSRYEFGKYILELRQRFADYLESEDPFFSANSILLVIDMASKLLYRQIENGISEVTQNGGFAERLSSARIQFRNADNQTGVPVCPICGKAMRKVLAQRGKNAGKPFWSCTDYPNCNGSRSM